MKKVWLVTITGFDALECPYSRSTPYSSERRALSAFVDWLNANGAHIPTSWQDGKFTHEEVDAVAQDFFGNFGPRCGPQDWSLLDLEIDASFADTLEKQEEHETESNFLEQEIVRESS